MIRTSFILNNISKTHIRASIPLRFSLANMSTSDTPPWHAAYPSPKQTSPKGLSREQVLDLLKDEDSKSKDFVLIDVRKLDFQGGTIRGSLNLPAQSLYPSIPTLYQVFKVANVRQVIWYCGSSGGRGTRTAGWFHDHIEESDDKEMESVILSGGIKGWAAAGGEFVEHMVEYDASVWVKK